MTDEQKPPKGERIRQGGLMRCCLATLDQQRYNPATPAVEGDKLACICKTPMRYRDGAWEWDH